MLDIKLIIENPDLIKARLLKKGYDVDFTEIIEKDAEKRRLQFEIESLKAERNKVPQQAHRAGHPVRCRSGFRQSKRGPTL